MQLAAVSYRGRRVTNDDVVFVGDGLVVLADGMGGHAGGQQAAQAAVGAALTRVTGRSETAVREAFTAANAAVREYQLGNPEHSDAGCTLTIVVLREVPAIGPQAIVGHAGDSPAFLVRAGELTLLTPPHTVADHLRREGRLTDEQAASHPGRNTLQRSVGGRADLQPEVQTVDLREGDRLMVCSDGLLDVPDRRRIRDIAAMDKDVRLLVEELAGAALDSSADNVTVAMVEVSSDTAEVASSRPDSGHK
jgi:serine/threonine protein phosphatase PrpC